MFVRSALARLCCRGTLRGAGDFPSVSQEALSRAEVARADAAAEVAELQTSFEARLLSISAEVRSDVQSELEAAAGHEALRAFKRQMAGMEDGMAQQRL
eukprot:2182028-Pleurochrysis_carterae.AAC.1